VTALTSGAVRRERDEPSFLSLPILVGCLPTDSANIRDVWN
jgi:hypothetical protein